MPTAFTKSELDIRAMQTAIIEYLKDLAVKKGIVANRDNAVVRDLLPDIDLGFPAPNWSIPLTANTWNTIASFRVPDKKLIVFYGIRNISGTPGATAISFKVGPQGAKTKDIEEIEPAYALSIPCKQAIFTNPILYENGQYLTILVYSKLTKPNEYLILLGYVVEPKGETISPD
jgi:hypothetical protein